MNQFLNSTRFNQYANDVFKMSADEFESIDDLSGQRFTGRLHDFINTFLRNQLPRLQELKRYYLADNNIKRRDVGRDKNRADNRIASDWAKYITVFMQGYMLGNPIQYSSDDKLLEKIEDFSKQYFRDSRHYAGKLLRRGKNGAFRACD